MKIRFNTGPAPTGELIGAQYEGRYFAGSLKCLTIYLLRRSLTIWIDLR